MRDNPNVGLTDVAGSKQRLSPSAPIELLLIHGTFAHSADDKGSAWWQQGSEFDTWLSSADGQFSDCQLKTQIFRWSGENLESERRKAAEHLATKILSLESTRQKYAIIAHSHGGSVAYHALAIANQSKPGLSNLIRLVTVGTPFLLFQPDFGRWLLLLPFLLSIYCLTLLAESLASSYPSSWAEFVLFFEWRYLVVIPLLTFVVAATSLYLLYLLLRVLFNQIRHVYLGHAHRSLNTVIEDRFSPLFSKDDEAIGAVGGTLALAGEHLFPRSRGLWLGGIDAILGTIGDQFVVEKLNERTQGADLPGLRLRWVGPTPARAPAVNWLTSRASERLVAHANRSLGKSVSSIRNALADLTWRAEPLSYLKAVARGAGFAKGLVHTNYFSVPEVRELIGRALREGNLHLNRVRTVEPPKLRGALPSVVLLYNAFSLAACAVVIVPTLLADSHLKSLNPREVVRMAIDQAPVPSASWEIDQGPPQVVRAIARLGEMDQIETIASKLAQSNRPLLMYSELAMGLADRGQLDAALKYVNIGKKYVQAGANVGTGEFGPHVAVSDEFKSFCRALARISTAADVDGFILSFSLRQNKDENADRGVDELRAVATAGYMAGGHDTLAQDEFRLVSDEYLKRDALSEAISLSADTGVVERLIGQMRAEDLRQDLLAELVAKENLTLPVAELWRLIGLIDRAAPRTVATSAMAVRLGHDGYRDQGVALIETELSEFKARKREPLEGLRIHYVRYATSLMALGASNRSREILEFAEGLPLEKVGDTTYSDFSGPDRALLWARLGMAKKAIALAVESAGLRDALVDDVGDSLGQAIGAEAMTKVAMSVTDPLQRTQLMLAGLGDDTSRATRRQVLVDLAKQANAVIDPQAKSAMLAAIATGWARSGSFRRALEIGSTTRSYHFLSVIGAMVCQFYGQAKTCG